MMSDNRLECLGQDLDEVAAYSVGVLLAATVLARALIDAGAVEKTTIRKMIQEVERAHEGAPPLMVKALEQFLMLIESEDEERRLDEPIGISVLTDFLDRLGKGCRAISERQ